MKFIGVSGRKKMSLMNLPRMEDEEEEEEEEDSDSDSDIYSPFHNGYSLHLKNNINIIRS